MAKSILDGIDWIPVSIEKVDIDDELRAGHPARGGLSASSNSSLKARHR
jgi:hypothetical protein